MSDEIALKVDTLDVHYKDFQALWNVSLAVQAGKIVSVIGANGSGKSTMLNTVAGLMKPSRGTITYSGQRIDGRPAYDVLGLGISLVPEGRRVFARLTVYENLMMGSFLPKSRGRKEEALGKLYELFPILRSRGDQMANTLSGGEQQMLAIARGLMSKPKLLMLDEPSMGIMPKLITEIFEMIQRVNQQEGLTILLVEQNVQEALELAHYAYILQTGRMVMEGKPADLLQTDMIKKAYLGL